MNKTCTKCNESKPIDCYYVNSKINYRVPQCKSCYTKYTVTYRANPKNKTKIKEQRKKYSGKYTRPRHIDRACNAWNSIISRAENKCGKYPTYVNVKNLMTRREFLDWAIPKYKEWEVNSPDVKPSINRKDSFGHYEISNLELISSSNNSKHSHAQHVKNEFYLAKFIFSKCENYNLSLPLVIKHLNSLGV